MKTKKYKRSVHLASEHLETSGGQQKPVMQAASDLREALCAALFKPHQRRALWGFFLQVFHQARPPQRVDCSAPMGNKRVGYTQKYNVQCQFGNRTRSRQPFDHQPDALQLC